VARGFHRRRHALEPEGFQAKVDFREQEGTRVDEEHAHETSAV